ncbi:hypothetical protein ACFQWA_27980 [Streptomyces thermogriseus]|uniref:hypothetical protein n=1 Tax=Streptomyces thermogriseus TaxID=75292 RepID=UPI00360E2545
MPSADEILQRMRAIQERREEAIRPLLALLAERSQLLKKLEELKEPYGRAYVMAEEGDGPRRSSRRWVLTSR